MKKNLLNYFFSLFVFLVGVFFVGCASKPKFHGKSEMCGVVVDEKNIPVVDFVVNCKKDGISKVAVTNDRGIFVFNEMRSGKYEISGEKKGYARLNEKTFDFSSREKVICCKVNSIEGTLSAVEKQIVCENYDKALELLDEVYFEKDSPAEATVLFYKAYVYVKSEEMKKAVQVLRRVKRIKSVDLRTEINELEELVNGKK